MRAARMRAAGSWAASRHEQRAHHRVKKSSFQLISTGSAAARAHLAQPTDDTHRAKALAKQHLAAKLMQPHFAGTPAECLNRTPW